MQHCKPIQLHFSEHVILLMLPVLLVAMHFGLLKFKSQIPLAVNLPVHTSYNYLDLYDENISCIIADRNGNLAFTFPHSEPQTGIDKLSFLLPTDFFPAYDTLVNNVKWHYVKEMLREIFHEHTGVFIVADKSLPYAYMKGLFRCFRETQNSCGWYKMYWAVNWQGHFQKMTTCTAN